MPTRTLGPVLALALALALLAPASAAGQARTLGSPLTAEPNINLGCETRLALGDDGGTGTYYAFPSNQPDCTWRQQGVFGVTDYSQDTRGDTAPGTGRITNIAVRSGPNPGLIRFVVVRELLAASANGNQGGSYCCYFVDESPVVRPDPPSPANPNGITNFATNLLVQRNIDNNQVLAVDHIGLSGVSNTGSLPLHSTGQNNAFYYTQPGSVNASFWHPRMGGLPNDQPAGRREEGGVPGYELLMRWTWCPAGQTCAGPVPPVTPVLPVVPGDTTVPRFTAAPRLTRTTFRPATGGAMIAARKAPRGTSLSLTVSEAATLRFTVRRSAAGRRVKGKCAAPRRANRRRSRCTRLVKVGGTVSRNVAAGAVKVRFTGRSGGKALKPGRYTLAILAVDGAGNTSRQATLKFTIVR